MSALKRNHAIAFAIALCLSGISSLVVADEARSFATGGYAAGLRTPEMMHKIDSNQDGMVSKDEWSTFQATLYTMMDADGSGSLSEQEFLQARSAEIVTFATGGYSNALRVQAMWAKLDADHDGEVTRMEFVGYHSKYFDLMDTGHTRMLGQNEFFGRGSQTLR